MNREYHKWYSPSLQREMELLVFGHQGARVLLFPTRGARFYDYEDWRVIDAISDKIDQGFLQVFCVDSVDLESLYCESCDPPDRLQRHLQYEKYIIDEVLPFTTYKNPQPFMISAGCSLGAYHAINLAFKYPRFFGKAVGMSGRYDLSIPSGPFKDLFSNYRDEEVFCNTPSIYVAEYAGPEKLNLIRKMEIIFIVGKEDLFLQDNRFLSSVLKEKHIKHQLHIWNEEAHKPFYWRKMVQMFL